MNLVVNYEDFKCPVNKTAPRPQSTAKLAALKEFIIELLRLKVIRVSREATVSQVLLVQKPGGKSLRFCVDYRELNKHTHTEGGVIPIIHEMLRRLGDKRPKYFAVMDLTQGYYQAPLSPESQKYTAFTTFMGVYEWTRVPMGLKNAVRYFQQVMSAEVLSGLIYQICEIYIDDIIVFGNTEDEFMHNLEQVFIRLSEKNITLNPKKCKFGLETIQYVGHTINKDGISFTRDKLDRVANFPKPCRQGELKSFLGLANYFHTHIKNHSSICAPLNNLLKDYHKGMKIKWNPEAEKAFDDLKTMIDNCPTLFFLDPNAPVYLHTDASEYGLGAYLFQIVTVNGIQIERPVEFISKAFTPVQLRWSIPEKEAYAIFYAVRRWDHLLRDIYFVLRTDHKNLVYLNEKDASAKIKRWKLLIQEYNFDIEHIAGTLNIIADAFSRLCDNNKPTHELDILLQEEFEETMSLLDLEHELWALDEEPELTPEISEKIAQCHNAMCGHGGVKRTVKKLISKEENFPHMRELVNMFIKACPFCQKQNYRKTDNVIKRFTTAQTKVMQRLSVDTVSLSEDEEGFLGVIVVICNFSRWVMCYPVRSLGAEDCAWALLQHFGIFGIAKEILSDNGTQFCNQIITELIKVVGAEHITTTPYSSEENSIVERSNKEVIRHLRAMLFDRNTIKEWRRYLPFAQRICNAEVISSIGESPARILFGGAIDLDRDILKPNKIPEDHEHSDMTKYVTDLISTQRSIIEFAKQTQIDKDTAHMEQQSDADVTVFPDDSYVLLDYPDRPPSKLNTKLRGPTKVIGHVDSTYKLRDLVFGKELTAHISRLRPWKGKRDPLEAAMRDEGAFLVESVVKHRNSDGSRKTRGNLEFHIKWVGYELEPNDWHPWKNFHSNAVVHKYLAENNLTRLIPEKFRENYK